MRPIIARAVERALSAILVLFLLITLGCQASPAVPQAASAVNPTPAAGLLRVFFWDVGQGDCEVIQEGQTNIIIDAGTGTTENQLVSGMKALGIGRFDLVVATHPHEDHIGGMDAVIRDFDIGTVIMPRVPTTTKTFTDLLHAIQNKGLQVTTPAPGTTFSVGDLRCTILAPNSQSYQDTNNYSVVMKVVYGNTSFLFAGDAQTESEQEMLARGYNLKSDVLKVGHHSSSSSSSTAFLQAVSPRYAVISVGAGNPYGHPSQATLSKLAALGATTYRTDLNSSITVTSDGRSIQVVTGR